MLPEGKGRNFGKLYHSIVDGGVLAAMKPTDLKVYHVLVRYADFKTRNARPTDQTIARKAGVHVSSVPPARQRLRAMGSIKAWRHLGRWHYNLPDDTLPNSIGVYPSAGNQPDTLRERTRTYRTCKECGRFSAADHIGHNCRKDTGGVLREKSGPGLETSRDRLEIPVAGSASASSGAEASPALWASDNNDWLIQGKVKFSSFYSHKFLLGALKNPSQKFVEWLRECGCTEDEVKNLLVSEYPSSK